MNLRAQMLLAGALTLAVPVLGWQSVRQLDASLQQTRIDAQTLKVANARVALAEAGDLQRLLDDSKFATRTTDIYAETADFPLFLDGYDDDWQTLQSAMMRIDYADNKSTATHAGGQSLAVMHLRFAQRGKRLFVFIDVNDDKVVFHTPPALELNPGEEDLPDRQKQLVNGDALELYVKPPGRESQHVLFRTVAPGPMTGVVASESGRAFSSLGQEVAGYRGVWVANHHGYQLEIEFPLPPIGSNFGLALIDVDSADDSREAWVGTLDPVLMAQQQGNSASEPETGRLFHASGVAASRLQPWVTPGVRARLFDAQGYLLSDVSSLYDKSDRDEELDPERGSLWNAILFRLFSYFVSADRSNEESPLQLRDALHLSTESIAAMTDTETTRYVTRDNDRVLGTLVPIGGDSINGYLLMESNEDLASAYAGSRLARLFSLLTLVSILAGGVLLIYASVLSLRIRKLSMQAELAVAEDGRVRGISESSAQDEIGDLSRNLSALLTRSANYTQYLEALSGRLSHELRTPLSVVKTSIENMNRDNLDSETLTLLDRASGGADQLGSVIRALVESTRLEQTVQQAQMIPLDVRAWIQGSLERYRQVYPDSRFTLVRSWDSVNAAPAKDDLASLALLHIEAAPELMQQALDKLVDNAIAFSNDQRIALLVRTEEVSGVPQILIAVVNRGVPVDAEQLPRLFDPMYSSRPADEGHLHLGLGLYIVRMIAEAHGGRAIALNQPPHVSVGMQLPMI